MNCDDGDMHAAAGRFRAAVRDQVITTEAGSVAVTASIGGVALPRHGRTINEAMARAQEALHQARVSRNGHFVAYAHSADRQERRRGNAALSSELVSALNEKRLRLAFQPVVEAGSRQPSFYEVLVRLQRADGSMVSDGEFIALSERLGLVRLIDHRVLDLSVAALAAAPEAQLSVNLSAETVGDGEWLSRPFRRRRRASGYRRPPHLRDHRDGGHPPSRRGGAFRRAPPRARLSRGDR